MTIKYALTLKSISFIISMIKIINILFYFIYNNQNCKFKKLLIFVFLCFVYDLQSIVLHFTISFHLYKTDYLILKHKENHIQNLEGELYYKDHSYRSA